MDMLRPESLRVRVVGPVAADVTDFASVIPAAAGNIEPSVPHDLCSGSRREGVSEWS